MFQFRRFPSYTYFIQYMMYELHSYGLLHSEICGSYHTCWSPQLIAAYRVLHRLPMPRHSPCALISLTIWIMSWILFVICFLRTCSSIKQSHRDWIMHYPTLLVFTNCRLFPHLHYFLASYSIFKILEQILTALFRRIFFAENSSPKLTFQLLWRFLWIKPLA